MGGITMLRLLVPVLLGLLFGCCTYLQMFDGKFAAKDPVIWVLCLFYMVLFCVTFHLFDKLREHVLMRKSAYGPSLRTKSLFALEWRVQDVVIGGLIVFCLWLPWLISLFPGVLWFDTSRQLFEILSPDVVISDRHPVFDAVIFAGAYSFGDVIFGDGLVGNWLLCIGQSIVASLALSASCCWLGRIAVPWQWRAIYLGVVALVPAFPLFFATLAKDTLFTPMHIVFCLIVAETVRSGGESLKDPRWLAAFIASIVIMSLAKKTAAIVVVPCLIVLVIAMRIRGQVLLACVLCAVMSVSAIPIFNASFCGATQRVIVHDWRLEAVAVPLQQVANAVRDDSSIANGPYASLLDNVFLQGLENVDNRYDWKAADGIKSKGGDADVVGFLVVWASLTPNHLKSYFVAWLGLVADWFSFCRQPNMLYTSHSFSSEHTLAEFQDLIGGRTSTLSGDKITAIVDAITKVPLLLLLSQKCLWATIVPCLCLYSSLRRRDSRYALITILPALLSMFVLMIGPTSIWSEGIRYVAPMMYTAPLWLSLVIWLTPDNTRRSLSSNTLYGASVRGIRIQER